MWYTTHWGCADDWVYDVSLVIQVTFIIAPN